MYIPHVLLGMTTPIEAVKSTRETFSFLRHLETLLGAKFASCSQILLWYRALFQ
jgi:hypothetical protein